MNRILTLSIASATGLLLVSCQGTDRRAASMNYADAVTSINQVDPAYRAYFRSQQGANYSVDEQRAALAKSVQTMRTPVPTAAPSTPRLATRSTVKRAALAKNSKKSTAKKTAMAKNGKRVQSKSARKSSGKALAVNAKKRR